MAEKLDINVITPYLDEGEMGLYAELSEDPDVLKQFQQQLRWMLPQLMSTSTAAAKHRQLTDNVNRFANVGWFELYYHPELQAKLLAACGVGKTRHKFFRARKKVSLRLIRELLERKYEDIRDNQVELWCRKHDRDDLILLAQSMGYQEKDIEGVAKAFDAL